ncbi:MAG: carbohydrate kinase family protein [Candidatus Pacebacteria bacterium]|nr:carbohydrate kinase family protein [Candidatus Paceibacterota bacterium]
MFTFKKKTTAKTPEFVAIGDLVIDAFIKLKNAHEVPNAESGATELCMVFGTKLPFEFAEEVVAVGNSANAAVSASRLGLATGLVAHVGADENGKKCLRKLEEEKVSTQFVGVHKGLVTNYHYVLWYGTERTILIKHENFPLTLPDITGSKWLYLSSLGEHSLPFHKTLMEYLNAHPEIKVVFQPGTYQIKFGSTALADIYKHSELFFCNLEEAQIILKESMGNALLGVDGKPTRDIKVLLDGLRALGPKLPVITDGPHGAYTYIEDTEAGASGGTANGDVSTVQTGGTTGTSATQTGEYIGHLAIYPDIAPPLERTGAGDAFASTFTTAIALGRSTEEALKWGSINSMNVCQHVGAQKGLLGQAEILEYIKKAPSDWKLERVG